MEDCCRICKVQCVRESVYVSMCVYERVIYLQVMLMARPLGPAESSVEPVWSKISKLRAGSHWLVKVKQRETAAGCSSDYWITHTDSLALILPLSSHTHCQRMVRHSNPQEPNLHWWVLSLKWMWLSCSGCDGVLSASEISASILREKYNKTHMCD